MLIDRRFIPPVVAERSRGFNVSIERLTYTPPRADQILDNITLEIKSGEFVAIVGPNGAGKSTLLRAIAGEFDRSDRKFLAGIVRIANQVVDAPVNQLIDGVGVVHQDDEIDLIAHLSVAQNISIRQMLGGGHRPRFWATPSSWRRQIRTQISDELRDHAIEIRELAGALSGGERQLLSVAIAVQFEHEFNPCRLLLLDEHTSKLDHQNSALVMQYTADQIARTGTTAVMVTHRYLEALRFANRIIVMDHGTIIADRTDVGSLNAEVLARLVEGEAG